MSGRRSLRRLLGVIVLCLTGTVAFAQTGQNFGELVGKAADDQGAMLPGVTVTLSGPAVMGAQTAMTNERGVYRFPAVPSGTYKAHVRAPGLCDACSRRRHRARPTDGDARCGAEGGDPPGIRDSVGAIADRGSGEHEGRRAARSADAADGAHLALASSGRRRCSRA